MAGVGRGDAEAAGWVNEEEVRGEGVLACVLSVSSGTPGLGRGLWVGVKQRTPAAARPSSFAGSTGLAGEDVLRSGPNPRALESSPSPSPFPGCSSVGHRPPGCSFSLSLTDPPRSPSPPSLWGSLFSPFFFYYLIFVFWFFFFSQRASVTNANTCRSRRVKPCRISVASATLPRSNPVVIPLSAHPCRLWLLFKGSKWDR